MNHLIRQKKKPVIYRYIRIANHQVMLRSLMNYYDIISTNNIARCLGSDWLFIQSLTFLNIILTRSVEKQVAPTSKKRHLRTKNAESFFLKIFGQFLKLRLRRSHCLTSIDYFQSKALSFRSSFQLIKTRKLGDYSHQDKIQFKRNT